MAQKKVYDDGWTSEPAASDRGHEFSIIRCPKKGIRNLKILSHQPLGRYTHHWKGRTTPCGGDHCKACDEGNVRRWYGWVFVIDRRTEEIFCFEYTKASAGTFKRYFSRNRTLRGAHLEAWRKDSKANGKLTVILRMPAESEPRVPKAPSRKKFLAKLWETNIKIVNSEPEIPIEDEPQKINGKPDENFNLDILKQA